MRPPTQTTTVVRPSVAHHITAPADITKPEVPEEPDSSTSGANIYVHSNVLIVLTVVTVLSGMQTYIY